MATTDRLQGVDIGVAFKPACTVASTASLTLQAAQTVDGIAVGEGERVLVTSQTDAKENGIYISDSSTWMRARDLDGARDAIPGTLVYVDRGSNFANTIWVINSSSTATSVDVGTDDIVWTGSIFGSTPSLSITADYTVLASDEGRTILCDASSAAITVTLGPAATLGDGFEVTIKKTDQTTNTVTVDGDGAETIDGAATLEFYRQDEWVSLASDVTEWHIKAGATLRLSATINLNSSSHDFTGIGRGAKKITALLRSASLTTPNHMYIQLGDASGVAVAGYVATSSLLVNTSGASMTSATTGFVIASGSSDYNFSGHINLTWLSTTSWVSSHTLRAQTNFVTVGGGTLTAGFTGPVTTVRLAASSAGTFDIGSARLLVEY